jgi:cell division protein FtsI (penicillin-binding protein 3)
VSAGPQHSNKRLLLFALGFMLCMLALLAKAINLQVTQKEFLQDQGEARYLREAPIPTMRGEITDRNGEVLAVSTPVDSVWVVPRELLKHPGYIKPLADILEGDAEKLQLTLAERREREFYWLRRRLLPGMADKVRQLDAPGVNFRREYRRFYPDGAVTAHIIGHTGTGDVGLTGLEFMYDDKLTGHPGRKLVINDRLGRHVEEVKLLQPAAPGENLQLTIDRRLQYMAYEELQRAMLEHDAESASLVLMDVNTGEVLAMVNHPSYNPNNLEESRVLQRYNRAITHVSEPGSVIKPIVMLAALQAGVVTPQTVMNIPAGGFNVGGHRITDTHYYGPLTATRVLTKSSNIAMAKIALQLDSGHLYEVLTRFGFGSLTGIVFPGESAGVLRKPERWRELEQATLGYGYGLSATTLQLAQAYSVLANGGLLYRPSLVKTPAEAPASVVDARLTKIITTMLETVITEAGTGTLAAVPMYRVAGKTGTAHIASVNGYSNDYISSFIGYAPVSNPQLVCAVVIHKPRNTEYYGGLVAAPVFSRFMTDALRLLNIAPDNLPADWQARQNLDQQRPAGQAAVSQAVNRAVTGEHKDSQNQTTAAAVAGALQP